MSDIVNSLFKGAGSAIKAFNDGIKKNIIDIQASSVINSLNSIVIKKSYYTNEKKVEDFILDHLNKEIGKAHSQYNIGGYLGLKVDVDLGDGQVGIEIKMAKELNNASNIERLFGQVIYYSKRVYSDKLIVCIVGLDKEYTQVIKEIEKFVKELGVNFIYLKIDETKK